MVIEGEPLSAGDAKQLIAKILRMPGSVTFSQHAFDELAKDNMTTVDALNVLRGGVVDPPELEKNTWRYRVRTSKMYVVVAFRSDTELRVITAWRVRR
jgi:hypothetical protein